MDKKLTERIQTWLYSDHTSEDMIRQGALMLLQLGGSRALYTNICRTPLKVRWRERLEYELTKHLKIRLDGMTRADVAAMDKRVVKQAKEILSMGAVIPTPVSSDEEEDDADLITDDEGTKIKLKGRRDDHDSLPAEVQNLFISCGGIYKRIRRLHTMLRSMEDKPSCDRYEHLKIMDELDETYRKRMKEYDAYRADQQARPSNEAVLKDVKDLTKEERDTLINNERSYIKRLKTRLPKAYQNRDASESASQEYEDMLLEALPRIKRLMELGGEITEKTRKPLRDCGLKFPDEE